MSNKELEEIYRDINLELVHERSISHEDELRKELQIMIDLYNEVVRLKFKSGEWVEEKK